MRTYISIIIIIILLLSMTGITLNWLNNFSVSMSELTELTLEGISKKDDREITVAFRQLQAKWEENHRFAHYVINHAVVDDISKTIIQIETYLGQERYEDALLELKLLNYALKHLSKLETVNLENIL